MFFLSTLFLFLFFFLKEYVALNLTFLRCFQFLKMNSSSKLSKLRKRWKKEKKLNLEFVIQPLSLLIPLIIALVKKKSRSKGLVTYLYKLNSYVWWDWERWEKEIDWMALQGVNLPLAFNGQEAIWQKVFMDFNISKKDLNGFFGGPAFLAWARMGNLHGWGGPLSQNWLDQQLVLQKQILYLEFLPSFSGNVPEALKKIFPSANITRLGEWNTIDNNTRCWCCTYLLDASDPLFIQIGKAFIRQQIKEYGDVTDIYNCDTFNENSPPTNDPAYISSLGAAIYKAMSQGDKDSVWLMQFCQCAGWLFYSDSGFWKPPQMKVSMCMLHNFGGNIEMYGILDAVSSGPVDARISKNSTMVGVGMCMEGIEQNPVVYELMFEMAFRNYNTDFMVNFPDWDPSLNPRYDISKEQHIIQKILTQTRRRKLFQETSSDLPQSHLWYSTHEVVYALRLFLNAGNELSKSSTYSISLVFTFLCVIKQAKALTLDETLDFHKNLVGWKEIESDKLDKRLFWRFFLWGYFLTPITLLGVQRGDLQLFSKHRSQNSIHVPPMCRFSPAA
ncbi:hypothetical protein PVL29_013805 [Vitis rotundifolia]|uniref:Alpha-N-acetylglucosaminidase tim-barrel domain-containing protein n=1 Tax=Vitis rotundifolia TaxID=103349 RepID=A0AA38ZMT4_VITRO|nr:hypothetical protein PVL29_013805 [Vitis rotundifolia]